MELGLSHFAGELDRALLRTDAMIAYDRSPDKLQLEIPVELEFMPIQHKGLEFIIPGRARLGGLNIYYPLSLAIATGI